ncbi:MAG: class I SAM-dependent methyltransferase [Vicinamibacterales bacterium]
MSNPYDVPARVAAYDADMDAMHPNRPKMMDAALAMLPFEPTQAFTALDLGIGTGLFTDRLLRAFPHASVIAIDLAPSMIALAKERLGERAARVDFRVGSFTELSSLVSMWERGHLVVSAYALHHLSREDKVETLRQAHRFLEPGGWCVNADLVVAESPALEARIQQLRVAGIVRRAGFRDERFKDASATRAFLDDLEAKDGDRPQTLADDLAALRAAGFRDAGLVWMEHREAVTVGVRS